MKRLISVSSRLIALFFFLVFFYPPELLAQEDGDVTMQVSGEIETADCLFGTQLKVENQASLAQWQSVLSDGLDCTDSASVAKATQLLEWICLQEGVLSEETNAIESSINWITGLVFTSISVDGVGTQAHVAFRNQLRATIRKAADEDEEWLIWAQLKGEEIFAKWASQEEGWQKGEDNDDWSSPRSLNVPFVLVWLFVGALFFTVYFRFVNLRAFRHALDVVRGKYDDPNHQGEVSHFQALTAALSGTVGVGNIAGVAVAVSLGGPGATFWMIIAGLFGMSSKFIECTLGLKYRRQNLDGSVSGGPMYYLRDGLAMKGNAGLGKVLAALFAIACIGGSFGGGNMVQINQATQQLIAVTGGETSFLYGQGWIFGTAMALIVGVVILGGIKSIAKVTDKIVPFMVGIYILGALWVILTNLGSVPTAFGRILSGAFDTEAMYGGLIGVLIQGIRRAAFSNEAGIGSASIAHSAAKTDEPVSEGIVALLEPFIDTVVICTMTALVIVITDYGEFDAQSVLSNAQGGSLDAIGLTSSSFEQSISWFPAVLSMAVILFALSTMISWSYYGLKAWTYLFGETKAADLSYKAVFCLFVIIGSAISASSVFDFGDAMIFAMCFPNVLGLYFLAGEVKTDLADYLRRVKSGEIKRYD